MTVQKKTGNAPAPKRGDKTIHNKATAGSYTDILRGVSSQAQDLLSQQKAMQDAGDDVIIILDDIEYEHGFKEKYQNQDNFEDDDDSTEDSETEEPTNT